MTDTAALQDLFWALREEHIAAGGILPSTFAELVAERRFADGVEWLTAARDSDFRDKPFRGI